MITHYDLFSGIGGFSIAVDEVFGRENTRHVFVEREPFCQAVLKKHWPKGEYYGDINGFIADTRTQKSRGLPSVKRQKNTPFGFGSILTGGFPCQPFSTAGRRKGTDDDRYLWPQMFECIKLLRPDWLIAENVAGLLTWNNGMVLEQVCADLESENYEVQPFVIPAVAVNAPHRRDRVWIVGNNDKHGDKRQEQKVSDGKKTPLPQEIIAMLPTPRTNEANGSGEHGTGGKDLRTTLGTKTGLKLQPAFALWMMGYPTDWCDLKDGEMPHSKRRATR